MKRYIVIVDRYYSKKNKLHEALTQMIVQVNRCEVGDLTAFEKSLRDSITAINADHRTSKHGKLTWWKLNQKDYRFSISTGSGTSEYELVTVNVYLVEKSMFLTNKPA